MHMSRQLEETKKTKFKRSRELEFKKNSDKKQNPRQQKERPKDKFDLWGDGPDNGC